MSQKVTLVSERETAAFPYLLGAAAEGGNTGFTVMASREDKAALILYRRGEAEPMVRLAFPEEGWGNLRHLTVAGLERSQMEYCLEIGGEEMADPYSRVLYGRPAFGQGHPRQVKGLYHGPLEAQEIPDMSKMTADRRYCVSAMGREEPEETVLRSGFLTEGYDWQGDRPLGRPWNETVLYQLHVRGFTMDDSAGVDAPGTFGGLVEKLPYLQKLGITAVELLPAYDFDENGVAGPVNYWGYTDGYFFAPKSAYCVSGKPCDVQFKDMVKAFHRAGVEVLMQFCFPQEATPELVSQALRFWTLEYHVDGFRVMGNFLGSAVQNDPVLAGRKLLNQGWDMSECAAMPATLDGGFLESMRRLLRGDEEQIRGLVYHMKNNPKKWPPVHWLADCNGFTLKDLVSYETKHNEANGENNRDGSWYNYSDNYGAEGPAEDEEIRLLRLKQQMNGLLLVFLSQGVPLLQAGDEMGHSKDGNNNSWCQDNTMNWLNWDIREEEDRKLQEFVQMLIAFRREHGVFRQNTEPQGSDYRGLGMPDVSVHGVHPWLPQYENFRRQLGVLYNGAYGTRGSGARDDSFYVMFNFHNAPHEFNLPKGPGNGQWYRKLDTSLVTEGKDVWLAAGEETAVEDQILEMSPRSIVILIEKRKKAVRESAAGEKITGCKTTEKKATGTRYRKKRPVYVAEQE